MKILIIGNGWLGNRCLESWSDSKMLNCRVRSAEEVFGYGFYRSTGWDKPDVILNAAGVVGKPNVDWCEDNVMQTYEGNTKLPLEIAKACAKENVYMLHIGTGCVYYGYKDGGWLPNDHANPEAVYTRTKYAADLILSKLPNVGVARIRMPIDSKPHPGNLLDKLISYENIVDVTNSITVVDDMIKAFRIMLESRVVGIHHIVNPDPISHKNIIRLYNNFVNTDFNCKWIKERELVEKGLAKKIRSNNYLNSDSLKEYGIEMTPTFDAIVNLMKEYKKNLV